MNFSIQISGWVTRYCGGSVGEKYVQWQLDQDHQQSGTTVPGADFGLGALKDNMKS